jgi:hypothetical protein
LQSGVNSFAVIGSSQFDNAILDGLLNAKTSGYAQIEPYILAELPIESAWFDERGVLTFNLMLPYAADYSAYIYGLALLYGEGAQKTIVSIAKTPKIAKVAGLGGTFVYKVAVLGEAGQIVFKTQDWATTAELEFSVDFQNLSIIANATAIAELTNRLIDKGVLTTALTQQTQQGGLT